MSWWMPGIIFALGRGMSTAGFVAAGECVRPVGICVLTAFFGELFALAVASCRFAIGTESPGYPLDGDLLKGVD